MSQKIDDPQAIQNEYQQFKSEFESVLLSTISQHGVPDTCYEDYVRHEGDYYIYASELATHTRNLMESNRTSMMFIEDGQIENLKPSHRRVVLNAFVERVHRASPLFKRVLELFQQRFSDYPKVIASMTEFHLFKIKPVDGVYVHEARRAFRVEGEQLLIDCAEVRCANNETRYEQDPSRLKQTLQ